MTAVVNAAELVVTTGLRTRIRAVSLCVLSESVATIVGRPGSGKSILLRALLGQTVAEGTLQVCGLDPRKDARAVRKLTTYIANPDVFEPHLTVRDNVFHLLRLAGAPRPGHRDLDRALRDSDVPDREIGRLASDLSPRMMFSAWLAIARLRTSRLVLLDDPTTHLHPSEVPYVATLLRELAATGAAILVTASSPTLADAAFDSTYHLQEGNLVPVPSGRVWPPGPSGQYFDANCI